MLLRDYFPGILLLVGINYNKSTKNMNVWHRTVQHKLDKAYILHWNSIDISLISYVHHQEFPGLIHFIFCILKIHASHVKIPCNYIVLFYRNRLIHSGSQKRAAQLIIDSCGLNDRAFFLPSHILVAAYNIIRRKMAVLRR